MRVKAQQVERDEAMKDSDVKLLAAGSEFMSQSQWFSRKKHINMLLFVLNHANKIWTHISIIVLHEMELDSHDIIVEEKII